jgi:hypothetical protein
VSVLPILPHFIKSKLIDDEGVDVDADIRKAESAGILAILVGDIEEAPLAIMPKTQMK